MPDDRIARAERRMARRFAEVRLAIAEDRLGEYLRDLPSAREQCERASLLARGLL